MKTVLTITAIAIISASATYGLYCFVDRENQVFAKRMESEYAACLGKGETEYTCKTYISTIEAKRSADIATIAASSAAITGAYSASKR